MKTLFLYEQFGEGKTSFFELEGDYRHLDGVLINGCAPNGVAKKKYMELQRELSALVFGDLGQSRLAMLDAPTKDWSHFVHCGFVP